MTGGTCINPPALGVSTRRAAQPSLSGNPGAVQPPPNNRRTGHSLSRTTGPPVRKTRGGCRLLPLLGVLRCGVVGGADQFRFR
jgi:hypothetical protein